MRERAEQGYTSATEFANQLVVHTGMSFRAAHKTVGEMVRTAIQRGAVPLQEQFSEWEINNNFEIGLSNVDPQSIARKADFGGGPGVHSFERTLVKQKKVWNEKLSYVHDQLSFWKTAKKTLDRRVKSLINID
ncbi:hypothetical protein D2Q93_06240 [Alicyclobacillaceae bacterium I2511]|nr:hypothetical protein D2Q93_06240 [Alicyclobacillaceae bacterium I2511]